MKLIKNKVCVSLIVVALSIPSSAALAAQSEKDNPSVWEYIVQMLSGGLQGDPK